MHTKEPWVMQCDESRDDFEAWVKNQHMLSRSTEPGYTDEYVHPWTAGAWAAWKECHERAKPAATDAPQITREQWEDARRVVACVNACAMISTETLEHLVASGRLLSIAGR